MYISYVYWNIFYFGAALLIYLSCALYVLLKLKFRVDNSGKVMITLYLVSMSIKLISWGLFFQEGNKDNSEVLGWLEMVDMNAQFLILLSFYYFIFEMRGVMLSLKARTTVENEWL